VADRQGYLALASLSPFRSNTVEIDPSTLPHHLRLKSTSEIVTPGLGALVRVHFASETGRHLLIRTDPVHGKRLPLGADVVDEQGQVVGAVGQAGRVEAFVRADAGRLIVRWGPDPETQCTVDYRIPPVVRSDAGHFVHLHGACSPGGTAP
jgi:outer membrane usher protein